MQTVFEVGQQLRSPPPRLDHQQAAPSEHSDEVCASTIPATRPPFRGRLRDHARSPAEIGPPVARRRSREALPEMVRAYIEIVPTDGVKYEIDKHSGYLTW